MPTEKSTYENKGLPAQLVTLTVGGQLVRQIAVDGADTIDLELAITQHKPDATAA